MNKMKIKIKIPREASPNFKCPTCTKSFTTGKGLGGHKRVHVEKKNKRIRETVELEGEDDGKKTLVSCPICPQSFPSEKSLHGHMRKHSDRSWRGMRPPPSLAPPPLLPPHEYVEVETGVKVEVRPSSSTPPLDHEAISLAHNLLALASGQPGKSIMGKKSLLVNDRVGFHQIPIKSQNRYHCDICGKMFGSYHALGGHKSHHSSEAKKVTRLYMEQPEGYNRPIAEVVENEAFDLNELPPESRAGFGGDQPGW